jgi:hypothetical protein
MPIAASLVGEVPASTRQLATPVAQNSGQTLSDRSGRHDAANYAGVPLEPKTHRAPEFPRLSFRRQVDSRVTSQTLRPAPSAEAESEPQMMLIPESRSKGCNLRLNRYAFLRNFAAALGFEGTTMRCVT